MLLPNTNNELREEIETAIQRIGASMKNRPPIIYDMHMNIVASGEGECNAFFERINAGENK